MELQREDFEYFLTFTLTDEAQRLPAGKRQLEAFRAFWMSRQGTVRGFRGSDQRLRRSVCVDILLRVGGLNRSEAAAMVATKVGNGTQSDVDDNRTGSYENPDVVTHHRNSLIALFFEWRTWVLGSEKSTVDFALGLFEKQNGLTARQRLERSIEGMRNDPRQIELNQEYLRTPDPQRHELIRYLAKSE